MYIYYNPNKKQNNTTDCVIRAICKLTNKSWTDVYWDLSDEGAEKGAWGSTMEVWGSYLRKLGFKRNHIPNTCPDCYTVRDFAHDHPKGGYIVATGEHLVAVENGNVYDSWDSSDLVPVYYYEKGR